MRGSEGGGKRGEETLEEGIRDAEEEICFSKTDGIEGDLLLSLRRRREGKKLEEQRRDSRGGGGGGGEEEVSYIQEAKLKIPVLRNYVHVCVSVCVSGSDLMTRPSFSCQTKF